MRLIAFHCLLNDELTSLVRLIISDLRQFDKDFPQVGVRAEDQVGLYSSSKTVKFSLAGINHTNFIEIIRYLYNFQMKCSDSGLQSVNHWMHTRRPFL